MKIKSENRVNAKMALKDRFPENVMSDGQQGFMDHSIWVHPVKNPWAILKNQLKALKRRFQNALSDQKSGQMKNTIETFKSIIEDCFHQMKFQSLQNEELQNSHYRLQDEIARKNGQLRQMKVEMEILYGELREKSAKIDDELPKLKRQIEIEKQNSRNTKRQQQYIMNELQKCNRLQPAGGCSTADLDDDRIKEYELLLDEKNEEVDDLVQVTDKTKAYDRPERSGNQCIT